MSSSFLATCIQTEISILNSEGGRGFITSDTEAIMGQVGQGSSWH